MEENYYIKRWCCRYKILGLLGRHCEFVCMCYSKAF